MKIYDITQEVFSSRVYPGDLAPSYHRVVKMEEGNDYNLSELYLGAHNGTHVDAPYHFIEDGKTIEEIDLYRFVGPCTVCSIEQCSMEEIDKIIQMSKKRILLKGNREISIPIAKLCNKHDVLLLGVESLSVGPMDAPMAVHLELLREEVVLLEGLNLSHVADGDYFLSCAPIKLAGLDGAPCRAILVDFSKEILE